jgi:hypothetical protein
MAYCIRLTSGGGTRSTRNRRGALHYSPARTLNIYYATAGLENIQPLQLFFKLPINLQSLSDPALPTFDLVVPGFEHELTRIPPLSWIPRVDDGEIREAFLRGPGWRDDIVLSVSVISDLGIRTISFPDDTPIERVWRTLVREVVASWAAPRMPVKHFEDAEAVRRILGVEGRFSRDSA